MSFSHSHTSLRTGQGDLRSKVPFCRIEQWAASLAAQGCPIPSLYAFSTGVYVLFEVERLWPWDLRFQLRLSPSLWLLSTDPKADGYDLGALLAAESPCTSIGASSPRATSSTPSAMKIASPPPMTVSRLCRMGFSMLLTTMVESASGYGPIGASLRPPDGLPDPPDIRAAWVAGACACTDGVQHRKSFEPTRQRCGFDKIAEELLHREPLTTSVSLRERMVLRSA